MNETFKDPPNKKDVSGRLGAEEGEVKRPNLAPSGKEGPGACGVGSGTDRLRQTSTERRELPGRTGLWGSADHTHTHNYMY